MKTKILIAAALAACLMSPERAVSSEEETTAVLETNYRVLATELKTAVNEQLLKPEILAKIFDSLEKSNEMVYKAEVDTDKVFKYKAKPIHLTVPVGLQIASISERPPFLRQDPGDLYNRYHSELVLAISTTDKDGKPFTSEPTEIHIPVGANPQCRWGGPNVSDVLSAIQEKVFTWAQARMDLAKGFYEKAIEYKRAKGLIR